MSTLKRAGNTVIVWLAGTLPAVAATGGREDHSGILVWAFLGLCALIVVAQALPAAMLLFGMVKEVLAARKPAREAAKR